MKLYENYMKLYRKNNKKTMKLYENDMKIV